MKKTKALLNKLAEEIEKAPIIQIACDKFGISRNTFYRWMKEDKEFLARINEAMSLGTGMVSDVALSNVLEGIKRKDSMYTKYWLSHKHPDFRRPYVFKVDSDDYIAHFRSTMEALRKREVEEDIKNSTTQKEKEKREQAEKEVNEWMKGWVEADRGVERKAKQLFQEWKREYEESMNKSKKRKDSK